MAVTLDIRLWFDEPDDVATRFCSLVERVSHWSPVLGRPWHRFVARDDVGGEPLALHSGEMPMSELRRLAAEFDRRECKLSTMTSARVRGVGDEAPAQLDVPLTVDCWGPTWIDRGKAFGPRCLVGDAAVWLHQCRPWFTRVEDDRAEANLEALTGLVRGLVDRLRPASLKVFTDVAPYLPIDAHVAYFRDAAAVIDDLQLLARAWTSGLPGMEPLGQAPPSRAFHEWRGSEGSADLHAALGAVIGNVDAVTPDIVDSVLRSGRFATYDCGTGVVVLDYPHFVNGFLDGIYLAALETAG